MGIFSPQPAALRICLKKHLRRAVGLQLPSKMFDGGRQQPWMIQLTTNTPPPPRWGQLNLSLLCQSLPATWSVPIHNLSLFGVTAAKLQPLEVQISLLLTLFLSLPPSLPADKWLRLYIKFLARARSVLPPFFSRIPLGDKETFLQVVRTQEASFVLPVQQLLNESLSVHTCLNLDTQSASETRLP